ncbi:MAG TPA: hypothetical protein VGG99_20460 [Acetobacteraceae bacterium]|jgi:hypothetical protein
MLTAAFFSLTLPLATPGAMLAWPSGLAPYSPESALLSGVADGSFPDIGEPSGNMASTRVTLIGPSNLLADRAEFGRATAAEIMSYVALQDNWDQEGANAPHPEAMNDALRMLEATPFEVGAPKPMVLASGDIALYWDYGEVYAEIGFDGSGTYYAYATAPDHEPVHLDDVSVYGHDDQCKFPEAVLEVLLWEPLKMAA